MTPYLHLYTRLKEKIPDFYAHPIWLSWAEKDFKTFGEKRNISDSAIIDAIERALSSPDLLEEIASESPPHKAFFRNWNKIALRKSQSPKIETFEEKEITRQEALAMKRFYDMQGMPGPYQKYPKCLEYPQALRDALKKYEIIT